MSVAGCNPVPHAIAMPNSTEAPIIHKDPQATEPSQRGAVWMNSRLKRIPRLTPITSWAAFVSTVGTAEPSQPAKVKAIAANKEPMNQGLVRPSKIINPLPAAVAKPSQSKPGHCASRRPGNKEASTVKPHWCCAHCMPKGMAITTSTKRMLCAAATKSVRAP